MTALLFCVAGLVQNPADPITDLMLEMESREWTPPRTSIPVEFVDAAKFAFAHGLADPTGGVLRKVTFHWRGYEGSERVVEAVGWVLPGLYAGRRVAVLLNGMIEPVASVGEVVSAAEVLPPLETDTHFIRFGNDIENPSPNVQVALLLRAGAVAAAEELYVARLAGSPLGDRKEVLVSLVLDVHADQAKLSHLFGDDQRSYRHASVVCRHLRAYESLIDDQRLASWREYSNSPLDALERMQTLRDDSARRLSLGKNPAPSREEVEDWVSRKRVNSLIGALEFVSARQIGSPGGVAWTADPIVRGLIEVGDGAVDELIDTYERDTRLTRSATTSRLSFAPDTVLPVKSAALAAIGAILEYPGIATAPDGIPNPTELRAYWNLFRDVPVVERKYAELADEVALPRQWLAAARYIVERTNVTRTGGWVSVATLPEGVTPAMKGEPLRDGRAPSVSGLLAKRVLQLRGSDDFGSSLSYFALRDAVTMAKYLVEWDAHQAAEPLSLLSRRILDSRGESSFRRHNAFEFLPTMSYLTVTRMRLGDTSAVRDYVEFAGGIERERGWVELDNCFAPLILYPEIAEFRALSEKLFSDERSPWHPKHNWMGLGRSEFCTLILVDDSYREAVIAMLDDNTALGSVTFGKNQYEYSLAEGNGSGGVGVTDTERARLNLGEGETGPLLVSDVVAFGLSRLTGAPLFSPLWDAERKSAARKELAEFVTKNSGRIRELLPDDSSRAPAAWVTKEPFKTNPGTGL